MKQIIVFLLLSVLVIYFSSCTNDKSILPKQRMYPHVDYPEKGYHFYENENCHIAFDIPNYSEIIIKNPPTRIDDGNNCWFNIEYKPLNGTLYCSYYHINSRKEFDDLVNDAFELVSKHSIKTNYRDEVMIHKPNDVSGILFSLDGPVASPVQFFLTDTLHHFFRASLYFNTEVNVDSIAPIKSFVEEDILRMIETFEWK